MVTWFRVNNIFIEGSKIDIRTDDKTSVSKLTLTREKMITNRPNTDKIIHSGALRHVVHKEHLITRTEDFEPLTVEQANGNTVTTRRRRYIRIALVKKHHLYVGIT